VINETEALGAMMRRELRERSKENVTCRKLNVSVMGHGFREEKHASSRQIYGSFLSNGYCIETDVDQPLEAEARLNNI
jgi:hypothetical protein